MKRLVIFLAAALLLTSFAPCLAQNSDSDTGGSGNGYIVKLKDSETGSEALSGAYGLSEISEEARLYHADSFSDVSALGDSVEYYERDGTATLLTMPDDTYASKQWSIDSTGISYAWEKGLNGKSVRIALIDSGVDAQHEELKNADIAEGYNVIEDSSDVTDKIGHGTFVCGVLAAERDNNLGIAGLCTDATLVPIKCFGDNLDTSASFVISSIYMAVDTYDCDVINLSLGIKNDPLSKGAIQSLEEAVEYAVSKGVIIVSAVGNDGDSTLYYPAALNCAIGVGSVDSSGTVASFSQKNDSVYVVAPGVSVIGLGNKAYDSYVVGSGTSYSTPFVTAAAAMLKQFEPAATYYDFATLLRESVADKGDPCYDTSYGYGSLNYEYFVKDMEEYNFSDIGEAYPDTEGHWAEQNIRYCVNNGLFKGVTQSSFEPDTKMTRAMFVTVLSRMSGEAIDGYPNPFKDVADDAWYAQACAWGYATGIVSGTGDDMFNPDGSITRQEIAVLLRRYAEFFNLSDGAYDTSVLSRYSDSRQLSSWARTAMAWASEKELITGRSGDTICPLDTAKRSEVATMLTRFVNTFSKA